MRTAIYTALLVLVVALTVVFNVANSEPLYSMRVIRSGPKTEIVTFLSFKDSGKDVLLKFDACGSLIELKTPARLMSTESFVDFASDVISKLCDVGGN